MILERFTDAARHVLVLAQEQARLLRHDYIGSEHLLLAHLVEGEGVSFQVLRSLGVRYEAARAWVVETLGEGPEGQLDSPHLPFTSRAEKTLQLALREALQLGHDYVGTEHLLLAMVREGDSAGMKMLEHLGVDGRTLQNTTIKAAVAYERMAKGATPNEPTSRDGAGGRDQPRTFAILRFLTPEELASTPSLRGGDYDEEAWAVMAQEPLTYVCPRCASLVAGTMPRGEDADKDGRLLHLEAVHQRWVSSERQDPDGDGIDQH